MFLFCLQTNVRCKINVSSRYNAHFIQQTWWSVTTNPATLKYRHRCTFTRCVSIFADDILLSTLILYYLSWAVTVILSSFSPWVGEKGRIREADQIFPSWFNWISTFSRNLWLPVHKKGLGHVDIASLLALIRPLYELLTRSQRPGDAETSSTFRFNPPRVWKLTRWLQLCCLCSVCRLTYQSQTVSGSVPLNKSRCFVVLSLDFSPCRLCTQIFTSTAANTHDRPNELCCFLPSHDATGGQFSQKSRSTEWRIFHSKDAQRRELKWI